MKKLKYIKLGFVLALICCIAFSCNENPISVSSPVNKDSLENLRLTLDSLLKLNNNTNLQTKTGQNYKVQEKVYYDSTGLKTDLTLMSGVLIFPIVFSPNNFNPASNQNMFENFSLKDINSLNIEESKKKNPELKHSSGYLYSKIINPLGLFYLKYKLSKTYYRELKSNTQNNE